MDNGESAANWDGLIEPPKLQALFVEKFSRAASRGRDRVGTSAFASSDSRQYEIISRKASLGTYRFSPFLERLVTKGRGKAPRVLSIPGLRDRLVLHQLKDYIHAKIDRSISRTLPNAYIRALVDILKDAKAEELAFVRADITSFYDAIPHVALMSMVRAQISDPRVLTLVENAIRTPTVSKERRRPRGGFKLNPIGVPQGLAISNALANFYLADFDQALETQGRLYLRYVDDILMIVPRGTQEHLLQQLRAGLETHALSLNMEKTTTGELTAPFEYLGYRITLPTISVRTTSVERFLHAIAAMLTRYRSVTRNVRLPFYLTPETRRNAFVEELNEKITGAISGERRYGWLFYFSEINDLCLLHGMDVTIREMLGQVPDLRALGGDAVKRLVRTYYEAKHSPLRGYIHNYNSLSTTRSRIEFLIRRARMDAETAERSTIEEINEAFELYRYQQLDRLEMDVGFVS